MINFIIKMVKRIVFAFLLLYGFNLFVNALNVFIPINLFTLGTVSCLGVPGLASLIAMFFIVK